MLFYSSNSYFSPAEVQTRLKYQGSLKLRALHKQSTVGPYDDAQQIKPGFFDVVGHDRMKAWKALGVMTMATAQLNFSSELAQQDGSFTDWMQH